MTLSQWWISLFLFALGSFCIFLSTGFSNGTWTKALDWNKTLEILGIAIVVGAVVEFCFHAKLRDAFRKSLREDLDAVIASVVRDLSAAAGRCHTLGITEVFEDENVYKHEHPLARELSVSTPRRLLCVGRSLMNLFTEKGAIQMGLEAGVHFDLAILSPHAARDGKMQDLTHLNAFHIPAGLKSLQEIEKWYSEKPRNGEFGSICLKFHNFYLSDTFLAYVSFEGERSPKSRFFWTHFYGSDPGLKRVLGLAGGSTWGLNLYERFEKLWQVSHVAYELTPEKQGAIALLLKEFENIAKARRHDSAGQDTSGE
jgi:hypothetical protein